MLPASDLTPPLEGLTYSRIDFDGYREDLNSFEMEEWRKSQQSRTTIDRATAINSDIDHSGGNLHKVLLDIDIPAKLIPSTTAGHSHLYIDKTMTTEQLTSLLTVLADVGIIEEGYARASISRGFTTLRLPWVPKTKED